MVVITIIGLLASTVLASMQGARVASRDAKVKSDIKQIQNALEIHRNANGVYPMHNTTNSQLDALTGADGAGDIRPQINPIPNSPHPGHVGGGGYRYARGTVAERDYSLLVRLNENGFNWCSVSMGAGNLNWNGDPSDGGGTNFPPCF